jgi:NhaP-type Na+/H+ or K+/H+ antiporter
MFAEQGLLSGLAWGATYVALGRFLAGETRSLPEIIGLILGHCLMFLAIGLGIAVVINWAVKHLRAEDRR